MFASLAARINDPDRTVFHRALRTAIATPALLALGVFVVKDFDFTLLAAFGSFAALGMADFSGPQRSRLLAYLMLCLVGIVLVPLGTALSNTLWPAVVMMLLIGTLLQFVVALGGQVALGNNAAILAFVVCVMVPAPVESIGPRLAGWVAALVTSALLAAFVWPRHERRDLYQRLEECARALGAIARAAADGNKADDAVAAAQAAVDRVRDAQRTVGFRPIGPAGTQQALVGLVDALTQAWRFAHAMTQRKALAPADRELARAVAVSLDAIADVLKCCVEGHQSAVLEVNALVASRRAHLQQLDAHAAAALAARAPGAEVMATFSDVFPLRVLSFVTLAMAADAIVMTGRTAQVDDDFYLVEPTAAEGAVSHAARVLAPHLSPRSVWFHNSLRGGVALALSVFVAKATDIGHAFWVVLATLSILRSNVVTTGSTVIAAIVGTFCGFLVATAVMLAFGSHPAMLWATLPIASFLAGYAPGAISFGAGQAMFALLVVELFNLIQPTGWEVGAVRVEAVATGAVVALVAALIIWPKGASAALRVEIAMHARVARRLVATAFGALLGKVDPAVVDEARAACLQARHRTDEALAAYIGERGSKHVPLDVVGFIARVPTVMRIGADAAIAMQRAGHIAIDTGDAARRFEQATIAVSAAYGEFADRLDGPTRAADAALFALVADLDIVDGAGKQRDDIVAAAAAYIDAHRDDPTTIARVMALAWGMGWLAYLAHIRVVAEPPLVEVLSQADTPWWR
jgi:uncharacterized membrane protein YccC